MYVCWGRGCLTVIVSVVGKVLLAEGVILLVGLVRLLHLQLLLLLGLPV